MNPRRLTDDQREAWEERAAIMEFDGELSREDAERAAWASCRDAMIGCSSLCALGERCTITADGKCDAWRIDNE